MNETISTNNPNSSPISRRQMLKLLGGAAAAVVAPAAIVKASNELLDHSDEPASGTECPVPPLGSGDTLDVYGNWTNPDVMRSVGYSRAVECNPKNQE